MNTLIKWPGGKGREFAYIKDIIPDFDRYIEPFFGGGAVFFNLEPKASAINDLSEDLINFYRQIKGRSAEFKEKLDQYSNVFDGALEQGRNAFDKLKVIFDNYDEDALLEIVSDITGELIIDNDVLDTNFTAVIFKYVKDKLLRTQKNNEVHPFSEDDLRENLATGFSSGVYMYFRHRYNSMRRNPTSFSDAERAANFYFIREYCYGSMFRFNSLGNFNIPYGGVTYNKKDFRGKVQHILSDEVAKLFDGCSICNLDFEEFLKGIDLNEKDFIFLDPPYDTEFSDYDGNAFTKKDQERLRDTLKNIPAKFILIIKNTDFIYSLYKDDFNIATFDKTYSYNVKSRNDRSVEHLIITNFKV